MSNPVVFVLGAFIFVVTIISVLSFFERLKLRRRIAREWQKIPEQRHYDKEESLKKAWQLHQKISPTDSQVDDITWHDLDLFAVFQLLNATKSSVGSEALYRQLRGFNFNQQQQSEQKELIDFFKEHDQARADSQYYIAQMGKRDTNLIWDYLKNPRNNQLGNAFIYYILGGLPVLSLVLLIVTKLLFFVGLLIISILVNIVVYLIKKQTLERELVCMNYLVGVLSSAETLGKVAQPKQAKIKHLSKKLRRIKHLGFAFRAKSGSEAEMLFEYLCIIFMLPMISYNLVLAKLADRQAEAIELLEIIGSLDVAMALLNFQSIMPFYSYPIFNQSGAIRATNMYHPLLKEPVANDVNWQRDTLVTGSNASGKSTYIKGVAINCLLAQTIGMTCAREWQMKSGHVLSSMALEDDLFQGDSYFVAEIKSVRRIIEQVKTTEMSYCFIDEILRGTNTIERIAASASIVEWLAPYQSLAFVATHDIELTEILKATCDNIHFEESVTESDGIAFDYLLYPGPAQTRNALKLLKVMHYPDEIVEQAEAKATVFDQEHKWSDTY